MKSNKVKHTLLGKNLLKRNIEILRTVEDVRELRSKLSSKNIRLGYVPTMGALHSGHMELMNRSKIENNMTIASIFVNPKQFSPGEDLDKYPRPTQSDIEILEKNEINFLFLPSHKVMYPNPMSCHVEPVPFNSLFEGVKRPEFFRGVATVVCKLFNIIQPSVAYFGQKDIFQCILVRKMVSDLNIPVDIIINQTIRDKDGLAKSSRNAYLTETERLGANILYKSLKAGADLSIPLESSPNSMLPCKEIYSVIETSLLSSKNITIEYISIASPLDMREMEFYQSSEGAIISSAIKLGNVRLIDNLLIGAANQLVSYN